MFVSYILLSQYYIQYVVSIKFRKIVQNVIDVPNAGNKLVTLPKRLEWNKIFKKHIEELDQKKPVIICGDMNVAHQEIGMSIITISVLENLMVFLSEQI